MFLLPFYHLFTDLAAKMYGMYGVSGRKKEAKHKRNEKNLEENWQMNWNKKCLSREYFDKILSQQKIRPNYNVVVLYYNLFEMPIWYSIEFLRFVSL